MNQDSVKYFEQDDSGDSDNRAEQYEALKARFANAFQNYPEPETQYPCFSIRIPKEIQDRIRDVSFEERISCSELVVVAVNTLIDFAEKKRNAAYPVRNRNLRRGRRIR